MTGEWWLPHLGIVEDEDALDQNHVAGVDRGKLSRHSGVSLEVVHWNLNEK